LVENNWHISHERQSLPTGRGKSRLAHSEKIPIGTNVVITLNLISEGMETSMTAVR